ncbi:MAG: M20/M25/M40 family metallo-hydrolase [Thermoleophilia bacterium]|nr:M20/M25/M40 family metallo-hydrolase [Thermoleophilia bacterium]
MRSLEADALAELTSFLAIRSVSADAEHEASVAEAADWIADYVRAGRGTAEIVDWNGSPLVDALVPASDAARSAPTVLCYGHFDVQPPAPLEQWDSDPFEATLRDGWLVGRGVADDKGQLWALLRAATELRRAGALPVNVRFCCDGEEEVGGASIVEFLEQHASCPLACLIFDTPMLDRTTHVFTTATRGTLYMHLEVQTGQRDLHSGIYGGAALNAVHVLMRALDNLFDDDGALVDELRAGLEPASAAERASWTTLRAGEELLSEQGAAVADASAARDFYVRTWEQPSLDVNGVEGGSPVQQKTIVVARARANLSMRLAAGQTAAALLPVVERVLRRGLPAAAQLELTMLSACDPGRVPADAPAVTVAADAFERVLGRRPLLLRSGGSLPIMPLLQRLGIPGIVTGFAVPDSNMHAPNERMRTSDLADAVAAAKETLLALGRLVSSAT